MRQLEVGDEVFFLSCNDGRGSHGAYCIVTKINRRSIKCTERERSYRAGKLWSLGVGLEVASVSYGGKTLNGANNGLRTSWGLLSDNGVIQ